MSVDSISYTNDKKGQFSAFFFWQKKVDIGYYCMYYSNIK